MSEHKAIVIPSITGTYITLVECAKISKVNYFRLFYWQEQQKLLPSFHICGLKYPRYEKEETLHFISVISDKLKQHKTLLQIKDELTQDQRYIQLIETANNHNNTLEAS